MLSGFELYPRWVSLIQYISLEFQLISCVEQFERFSSLSLHILQSQWLNQCLRTLFDSPAVSQKRNETRPLLLRASFCKYRESGDSQNFHFLHILLK